MRHRLFGSMPTMVAMIAVSSLALGFAAGQAPTTKAGAYTPPRTPDGQPDIQGMWLPGGLNLPMERPSVGEPPRTGRGSGPPMVVDPPDGKIPLQPWAAAKRATIIDNQDKLEFLDPRVLCLPAGVPRATLPITYNTYQFLQIPGYVILLYEWNHLYRVIPLDGGPHVNPNIRLWMGDSRGRWEGKTLVVDVTNFTDKTWAVGHLAPPAGVPASSLTGGQGVFHSEALHVVERFTLVDADTIGYEATIEDPKVFTRPWKIAWNAFQRAPKDHMLYEYACWEGGRRHLSLMTGIDIK